MQPIARLKWPVHIMRLVSSTCVTACVTGVTYIQAFDRSRRQKKTNRSTDDRISLSLPHLSKDGRKRPDACLYVEKERAFFIPAVTIARRHSCERAHTTHESILGAISIDTPEALSEIMHYRFRTRHVDFRAKSLLRLRKRIVYICFQSKP